MVETDMALLYGQTRFCQLPPERAAILEVTALNDQSKTRCASHNISEIIPSNGFDCLTVIDPPSDQFSRRQELCLLSHWKYCKVLKMKLLLGLNEVSVP